MNHQQLVQSARHPASIAIARARLLGRVRKLTAPNDRDGARAALSVIYELDPLDLGGIAKQCGWVDAEGFVESEAMVAWLTERV